jgi:hypothetical protein
MAEWRALLREVQSHDADLRLAHKPLEHRLRRPRPAALHAPERNNDRIAAALAAIVVRFP